MSSRRPTKKQLPTGEEPRRGFETLVKKDKNEPFKVGFVMLSHLSSTEKAEIEMLREKSLGLVRNYTGLSNEPLSLEKETRVIAGVDEADQMFALAYLNKMLAGYALITTGWPAVGEWVIQHMIIDPDLRHRGIGSAIVKSIEQHALESSVAADAIRAIPVQESGRSFWQDIGYTVEAGVFPLTVDDVDHEVVVYKKILPA